jgi:hypothetical protein
MVTDKFPDAMPPRIIQHDILMWRCLMARQLLLN